MKGRSDSGIPEINSSLFALKKAAIAYRCHKILQFFPDLQCNFKSSV